MVKTIRCKSIIKECDLMGYNTLVFKVLENDLPFGCEYVMCVVFPNWQSRIPNPEESGFLTYNEVTAGKDTWYSQETDEQIPYKYTNNIFIRFVKEKDNLQKDDIII